MCLHIFMTFLPKWLSDGAKEKVKNANIGWILFRYSPPSGTYLSLTSRSMDGALAFPLCSSTVPLSEQCAAAYSLQCNMHVQCPTHVQCIAQRTAVWRHSVRRSLIISLVSAGNEWLMAALIYHTIPAQYHTIPCYSSTSHTKYLPHNTWHTSAPHDML